MASNNSSAVKTDGEHKSLVLVLIQSIAMVTMMVVGTFANGVICHCILKNTSLRTATNIFIMNLAATDFLLCVLCMPFALVSCILDEWIFGDLLCKVIGFLLSLLYIASILTLVLVAIDRYMAIKHPLKYCALMTNTTCTIMLVVVWSCAALCSLLPALGWGNGYTFNKQESICRPEFGSPTKDNGYTIFLFVSAFAVPFSVLATLYLSILWTARKQFRQVHVAKLPSSVIQVQPKWNSTTKINTNNHHTTAETENTEITSATNTAMNKYGKKKLRRRNKTRGFKMLVLIVLVFIICWAPYFILIFYSSISHVKIPLIVKALTTWLAFLNSSMNPFLYGFLNGKFRSSLKSFLGDKLLCCQCLFKVHEDSHVFHINH